MISISRVITREPRSHFVDSLLYSPNGAIPNTVGVEPPFCRYQDGLATGNIGYCWRYVGMKKDGFKVKWRVGVNRWQRQGYV